MSDYSGTDGTEDDLCLHHKEHDLKLVKLGSSLP